MRKSRTNNLFRILFIILLNTVFLEPFCVKADEGNVVDAGEEEMLLMFFDESALVNVATLSPQKAVKAPATISLIKAEQIKNMGARNLTEILVTVPGFGLQTSQGWGRNEIEVRGISGVRNSGKVLVLVDGHRLNDPFFGGATTVTDDFPLENVKQIEIIRGPGSALYGSNAFMAVINIVTKKSDDINGMQINFGKGSFNSERYNFMFGKNVNGIKFSGNFNYFTTDSQRRYIAKDGIVNEQDMENPLFASIASEAPGFTNNHRERYDIQINIDYKDLGFMGRFINKEHGTLVGPRDTLADDNLMKFGNLYTEIHYKHEILKSLKSFQKLYYNRFDMDFFFEIFPEGSSLGPVTYPRGVIYRGSAVSNTIGYDSRLEYELFDDNLLTGGFTWEYTHQGDVTTKANFDPRPLPPSLLKPIMPSDFQDVSSFANFNKNIGRTMTAFYIQDDWNVNDKISLTLGLRHDNYNDVGGRMNPRAAMVFSPTENLDIKVLHGWAFRAPSFDELYNRNNKGVVGDSRLKPEKLKTSELGFEYRLMKNLSLSANCFYSEIEDIITLDTKEATPRKYHNLTDVKSYGNELELKAGFWGNSYAYVNYSYQRSIDDESKRRLPNVPKHRGNIGINLCLGKHVNIQPRIFISGKRLREDGNSRETLGGYALVDFSILLKNFYDALEVRGSIHNLLDKSYVYPSPNTLPNDYPQQGRDFFVTAYYRF